MLKRLGVLGLSLAVSVTTFAAPAFADEIITNGNETGIEAQNNSYNEYDNYYGSENAVEYEYGNYYVAENTTDYETDNTDAEEIVTEALPSDGDDEISQSEEEKQINEDILEIESDFAADSTGVIEAETNEAAEPFAEVYGNSIQLNSTGDEPQLQLQATQDDWEYSNIAGGVKITAYHGTGSTVTIPAKLNGYNVLEIGEKLFQNNTVISSVVIPNSVKYVYGRVFQGCTNLKSVTFGSNVKEIGDWIFDGCSSLGNIVLPNSLTYIGKGAFYGTALKSITIPANVETCADYYSSGGNKGPFYGCDQLRSVTFVSGMKYIPANVLRGATTVTSVSLPKGITSIGANAFALTSIETIKIPNTVKEISEWAFNGCSSLGNIVLPNSLTYIGKGAFYGTALKSITIPANVETCADYYSSGGNKGPFYGCDQLRSVTFVSGMKYIPANVLRGATTVTSVSLPKGITSIGANAFALTSIETIKIPNTVKEISEWAFNGCSSLENIVLPNSLTYIGKGAFYGTAIKSITIPANVETCADYYSSGGYKGPFYGCDQLRSVTFASGMKYIPYHILKGNTTVETVTIPLTVTWFGDDSFEGCTSLKNVIFEGSKVLWGKITNHHVLDGLSMKYLNKKALPSATKVKKVKAGKKAFKVKWKKQTNLTEGYQIQYGTNKKFKSGTKKINIKNVNTTSKKIKKLKSKKTYYVRVRTYNKLNGKKVYSSWSAAMKVKTK